MDAFLAFCSDNPTLIEGLVLAILAIISKIVAQRYVGLNKTILFLMKKIEEDKASKTLKTNIAQDSASVGGIVHEIITQVATKVDEKKEEKKPKVGAVILREVVRGLPVIAKLAKALCIVACLTILAGCITVTAPDGTVTRSIDANAIVELAPVVDAGIVRAEALVTHYQEQKTAAEIARDKPATDRADRMLDMAEKLLDRKISEAAGLPTTP